MGHYFSRSLSVQAQVFEIRWIDPEQWGRYGWTFLFTCKMSPCWNSLVKLLPKILPCFTCKKGCAKFVERAPPPLHTASIHKKNKWLSRLRRSIQQRNIESKEITKRHAKMIGYGTDDSQRFVRKLQFPYIWYMEAFVFFACVLLTANYQTAEGRSELMRFLQCANNVAGLPVNFEFNGVEEFSDSQTALSWLFKSPNCPPVDDLVATLRFLPIKTRLVKKSSKACEIK